MLLVEDDLSSASALRAILTRRGCDVVIAPTLAQGMGHVNEHFDAIVLDLMLPDGDGTAILREVREKQSDVRVAVTTAVSDPERLSEVRKLRPDRLLRKPIDLDELLEGIGIG